LVKSFSMVKLQLGFNLYS